MPIPRFLPTDFQKLRLRKVSDQSTECSPSSIVLMQFKELSDVFLRFCDRISGNEQKDEWQQNGRIRSQRPSAMEQLPVWLISADFQGATAAVTFYICHRVLAVLNRLTVVTDRRNLRDRKSHASIAGP